MAIHQYATDSMDCEYSIAEQLLETAPVEATSVEVIRYKRGRKADAGKMLRETREIDALANRHFAPRNEKIGKTSRGIQTLVQRSSLMLATGAVDFDAMATAMVAEYLLEREYWQDGIERVSKQQLIGTWQFEESHKVARQSEITLALLERRYDTAASMMITQHNKGE